MESSFHHALQCFHCGGSLPTAGWHIYHLLCLSEVEVDFGGGHHQYLAVDMQGIVAAVRGAVATFLGEIVTVM